MEKGFKLALSRRFLDCRLSSLEFFLKSKKLVAGNLPPACALELMSFPPDSLRGGERAPMKGARQTSIHREVWLTS